MVSRHPSSLEASWFSLNVTLPLRLCKLHYLFGFFSYSNGCFHGYFTHMSQSQSGHWWAKRKMSGWHPFGLVRHTSNLLTWEWKRCCSQSDVTHRYHMYRLYEGSQCFCRSAGWTRCCGVGGGLLGWQRTRDQSLAFHFKASLTWNCQSTMLMDCPLCAFVTACIVTTVCGTAKAQKN